MYIHVVLIHVLLRQRLICVCGGGEEGGRGRVVGGRVMVKWVASHSPALDPLYMYIVRMYKILLEMEYTVASQLPTIP